MNNDIFFPTKENNLDIPFFLDADTYLSELRIEALKKYLQTEDITPTGSRHIEWPPKKGTDDDYLIFVPNMKDRMDEIRTRLVQDGWFDCLEGTSEEAQERYKEELYPVFMWGAFRMGETNIVVYTERQMYDNSVEATHLCTKLNVRDKERRIRIFRWFKFGEDMHMDDLIHIPRGDL